MCMARTNLSRLNGMSAAWSIRAIGVFGQNFAPILSLSDGQVSAASDNAFVDLERSYSSTLGDYCSLDRVAGVSAAAGTDCFARVTC